MNICCFIRIRWSFLLITIGLISFFVPQTIAQPKNDKITPQERKETLEFAHMFWNKLGKTKDIRPLIKKYGIKDFYKCLKDYDFALIRASQIRSTRRASTRRYYIAETNFWLLLMLSGLNETDGDDMFATFPTDIQNAITRSTWDAIEKNGDSDPDEKPKSDVQVNAFFDQVLGALERANPKLRKYALKNWQANYRRFKEAAKDYEANASYGFEPELRRNDKSECGLPPKTKQYVTVDLPGFQLMLVNVRGKYRVVQFPFHID